MTTPTDFPMAYMRLRTLLDAVVVNTMRYCLDGGDIGDSMARMKGVEADLMNMIDQVGGMSPCDAGYFNCGGVCVPYTCVEAMYAASAERAEMAEYEPAADDIE